MHSGGTPAFDRRSPRGDRLAHYPVVFAFTFWLANYVASAVDLTDAVRSAGWVIAVALVLQVALTLLLGIGRGAIAALLVGALLLRLYPVLLLALAAVLLRWLLDLRSRRLGVAPPGDITTRASTYLNAVSLITCGLVVFNGMTNGALGLPRVREAPSVSAAADAPGLPDIYLVLLDGHASLETLETRLGYDTRPFAEALAARGFDVLDDSRSNYAWTPLTLLSLTNARHVEEIVPPPYPDGVAPQFRLLMSALRGQPAGWRPFREAGYVIGSIPPTYVEYGLVTADEYLDSRQLNSFELDLLSQTLLANAAPQLFSSQIRDRTLASFEATRVWADTDVDRPRLLLTHLLIPHAPYVFKADGSDQGLAPCFPNCSALQLPRGDAQLREDRYRAQVRFTHDGLIELIDDVITSSDREAVIVLFSDHGSRLFQDDPGERLDNFMAVRTPDGARLLEEDATPIEILPALAAAYLGVTMDEAPRLSFQSPLDRPFPLTINTER